MEFLPPHELAAADQPKRPIQVHPESDGAPVCNRLWVNLTPAAIPTPLTQAGLETSAPSSGGTGFKPAGMGGVDRRDDHQ